MKSKQKSIETLKNFDEIHRQFIEIHWKSCVIEMEFKKIHWKSFEVRKQLNEIHKNLTSSIEWSPLEA